MTLDGRKLTSIGECLIAYNQERQFEEVRTWRKEREKHKEIIYSETSTAALDGTAGYYPKCGDYKPGSPYVTIYERSGP